MNPSKIRFRHGVIDVMKRDRNLDSDAQAAAVLGIGVDDVERLRQGALISGEMALQFAAVQGTGTRIDQWVEYAA